MFAAAFVPLGIITIVASMILPLPPFILDFLLVGNIILALILFFSALYIEQPVRLSVLPALLLLATMYRLSLNISSTRLILSGGNAGEVISAFGGLVTNGSLIVGAVVFAVITLVQFIVIAKGAERVAEVSARFTLDALPGKQMSIDADVRSGLIDFQTARVKREDLQVESKFYGALDGAMKFVKGDAIAGMLITVINVIGGLAIGIAVQDLDPAIAVNRYTMLTVGDGLLSQLPALLNSLAAGMIVTRVSREGGGSLSQQLLSQLGGNTQVCVLVAMLSFFLACVPVLPALPFVLFGAFLLFLGIGKNTGEPEVNEGREILEFVPHPLPVVEVLLHGDRLERLRERKALPKISHWFQQEAHSCYGLLVSAPEFRADEECQDSEVKLKFRGQVHCCHQTAEDRFKELLQEQLSELLKENSDQFIDDQLTRRMLDAAELWGAELIESVVPDIVSVTQITILLRGLIQEGVPIHSFDVIVQALAESGEDERGERALLERVRLALRRVISAGLSEREPLEGYLISPAVDLRLFQVEHQNEPLPPALSQHLHDSVKDNEKIILCSSGTRAIVRDILRAQGGHNTVVAHEELAESVHFASLVTIDLPESCDQSLMAA